MWPFYSINFWRYFNKFVKIANKDKLQETMEMEINVATLETSTTIIIN